MKTSHCQCGNRVFFDNTQCQSCQSELGFLPDEGLLSAILPTAQGRWKSTFNDATYRKCRNYEKKTSCNWMIVNTDRQHFCVSCRLSEIIPDLSKFENVERWNRVERAKRRLIYSIIRLGLRLIDKKTDPVNGLSFQLMEDHENYSEFAMVPSEKSKVFTGHLAGTITLNIEEADTVLREVIRTRMQERYRTLLGHLRHESGHYYWDQLVKNTGLLEEFRLIFGDDQEDYPSALRRYYREGPRANWQSDWISAYASSHPWEDWAECWAHYLHMIDTLETAYDFGGEVYASKYLIKGQQFDRQYLSTLSINQLMDEWRDLSEMLNEMNRSLGLADAYPFYMSGIFVEKMSFVHKVILS